MGSINDLPVIDTCADCAACCRGRTVPPFDGRADPELLTLPEHLRKELIPLLTDAAGECADEAACAWLDLRTLQCKHYEHRPAACRDFERGSFYCRLFRRRRSIGT